MFWIKEKFVSLHRKTEMKCSIGLWCNGNTTDSGPVIPGSNPGSPTQHTDKNPLKSQVLVGFLLLFDHVQIFHNRYSGLSGNIWLVSFKISYLCLPLFYETRTTPSCHPSGCAYRQL